MIDKSDSTTVWQRLAANVSGCGNPQKLETVQSLWSGFGSLFRVATDNTTLIVKHVNPPVDSTHPRGWQSDFATQRKLKSYQVETHWYQHYSNRCTSDCQVPLFLTSEQSGLERWLLLQDLDAAGYPLRFQSLQVDQAFACLDWLANFHAVFLHTEPDGLWATGCYWHLDTRPDEYQAMQDGPLKQHAQLIDQILNQCRYQTLVHGDAKVANFCFSNNNTVAAVDFQYIGGGCGIKDVAYFIGSCFSEDECIDYEDALLDRYFDTLNRALQNNYAEEAASVVQEWRSLYALAWTDFYRFLNGWMPDHKKIHRYTKQLAEQTFDQLPEWK